MGNSQGQVTRICQRDISSLSTWKISNVPSSCIELSGGIEDTIENAVAISNFIARDTCNFIRFDGNNPIILDELLMRNRFVGGVSIGVQCMTDLKARINDDKLRKIRVIFTLNTALDIRSESVLNAVNNLNEYCKIHDSTCRLNYNYGVNSDELTYYLRTMVGKNIIFSFDRCYIGNGRDLWSIMRAWARRPGHDLHTFMLHEFVYNGRHVTNHDLWGNRIRGIRTWNKDVERVLDKFHSNLMSVITEPPQRNDYDVPDFVSTD